MGYFAVKKAVRYLNSKDESQYTSFDKLLKTYLSGELFSILLKYEISDIDVFLHSSKKGFYLQISFKYVEMFCCIDFDEKIMYTLMAPSDPIDANNTVEIEYPKDFDIKTFLDEMIHKAKFWGLVE